MKIVFTGGGTGGHFYPLIAVAEAIAEAVAERTLVTPRLYYLGKDAYDEEALFRNDIQFIRIDAGKVRRYFSLQNLIDVMHTVFGFVGALVTLFRLYPDVVISKGGYQSVPVVLAARVLDIPLIIHESDSKPGRANLLAARFADRIGIAFASAAAQFPNAVQSKIALIGIPIRREVMHPDAEGAKQELGLDAAVPTVFIVGGSTGSHRINETIIAAVSDMVGSLNVIHQTGRKEFAATDAAAKAALVGNTHASRYHAFPFLTSESIRRAAGAANVIVSRAGATAIAEISHWGKPAILIPIPESVSHDQRTNAYAYAHTGAAEVIEEANLTPHVLTSEVKRIAGDVALAAKMGAAGATFMPGDAARIIADEALRIALSHEAASEPPLPTA